MVCIKLFEELFELKGEYFWVELSKRPLKGSVRVYLATPNFFPRYRFDEHSEGKVFLNTIDTVLPCLTEEWQTFYFRVWQQ